MQVLNTLVLATLLASSGFSHAHGEAAHAKTPPMLKKEQKEWGIAGDATSATRTIEVTMLDAMRFSPERIDVNQGETVRFLVRNTGAVLHEFVIGTKRENDEHAAMMAKFPGMQHDEPYMTHVQPGKTGTIVWTFNRAGAFDFACLIAGHYQAGMRGKVVVAAARSAAAPHGVPGAVK